MLAFAWDLIRSVDTTDFVAWNVPCDEGLMSRHKERKVGFVVFGQGNNKHLSRSLLSMSGMMTHSSRACNNIRA